MSRSESSTKQKASRSGESCASRDDACWKQGLLGKLPLGTLRKWTSLSRKGPGKSASRTSHAHEPVTQLVESEYFEVRGHQAAHVLHLRLPNVMDGMVIDRLIGEVLQMIHKHPKESWIIDLEKVVYMGSPLLGLMINVREQIRQAGGTLLLCGVSAQLQRTFQACCFERLFTVVKTCGDAVAVLRQAA